MSNSQPRQLKDNNTDHHEWPALLASLEGHTTPCTRQPADWFSDQPAEQARAARFCQGCPVLEECRAYALASQPVHGVWGGLTPAQRKRIRREQRKAKTNGQDSRNNDNSERKDAA